MSFAHFNFEQFPFVVVTLAKKLDNSEDFKQFINDWKKIYMSDKNFIFIFNTSNVSYIGPQYCLSLSAFIRDINKHKRNNLKSTYIIINKQNNIVLKILDVALMMQTVHTPVYITNDVPMTIINSLKARDNSIVNYIVKRYEPKSDDDEFFDNIFET
jgi:hypothetical protein